MAQDLWLRIVRLIHTDFTDFAQPASPLRLYRAVLLYVYFSFGRNANQINLTAHFSLMPFAIESAQKKTQQQLVQQ